MAREVGEERDAPPPELLAELGMAVRRMSAQSVLLSQTVADRFGMNTSDLEVLDLIVLRGQASAGELAAATGLTSGSMTALIDRLVDQGFAERRDDPDDRRRVLVHARPDAMAPIEAVYADLQAKVIELWSGFRAAELDAVLAFVTKSTALSADWIRQLRETAPPPGRRTKRGRRV